MSSVARITVIAGLALATSPALAHSGHELQGSFLVGLSHPLFGWDHLLAMLAVGLWAGLVGGRSLWAWPLAFVVGMAAGGALGLNGIALPASEHAILLSVLLLGGLAALALRVPAWLGALLVVVLAVTHGNVHGLEAPAAGGGLVYALGFLLATAMLHGAGLAAALGARRGRAHWLARALGLGAALGGLVLAVG